MSWGKPDGDGNAGSDKSGFGSELEQGEAKSQEPDAHRKTSEALRRRGWGLHEEDEELEENEERSQAPVGSSAGGLSWAQSTEDSYWENTSRVGELTEEASPGTDARNTARSSNKDDEERLQARVNSSANGLSWAQSTEDSYWENTSRVAELAEEASPEKVSRNTAWGSDKDDLNDASTGGSTQTWRPGVYTASGPDDMISEATRAKKHVAFGLPVDAHPIRDFQDGTEQGGSRRDTQRNTNIDYQTWLPIALEQNDHDTVARCLYAAGDCLDFHFIRDIPEATFTDILHVLEPRQNIGELSDVYTEISERLAREINIMPVGKLMYEYGRMLRDITIVRRRSGHRLTNAQYLVLLRSAQDLGEPRLAGRIWGEMHQDGVVPDLDTYNAYMASHIYKGQHNSTSRHHERVINHYMKARNAKRRDPPYENYSVGVPMGVKERAMIILDAMLKNGITANEETYRLIIVAAAREGEMDTVDSILLTTWNINVSALMRANPGDDKVPDPKELARDSPQYPTYKLMRALAYAFAINNQIPTALRLVDYISRAYNLTATREVWEVVFEWTFVLSRPRYGTAARGDRKTGQLPQSSLLTLWNTMTRAPYFIEPTMSMYNHMIKNLSSRAHLTEMISKMVEAKELFSDAGAAKRTAWDAFQRSLDEQASGAWQTTPVGKARRQWEDAVILASRNDFWMKGWVRLLCRSTADWDRFRWEGRVIIENLSLGLRVIPRLLGEWKAFAGSYQKYELPTGVVEIQLESEEDLVRVDVERERDSMEREKALNQAKTLVGDRLLRARVDHVTNRPIFSTKRLRLLRGEEEEVEEEPGRPATRSRR